MRRLAVLLALSLAAPARAARYADSKAVQGRLDKIAEATRAIDVNLDAMRRSRDGMRGTPAEHSLDATISALEGTRRSLDTERGSLVTEKARLEKLETRPAAGETAPVADGQRRPPGAPAAVPGGARPAADAPDIPAAEIAPAAVDAVPSLASAGAVEGGASVDAAGAAKAERAAKAGEQRSGAAAARAAKLGAQLGAGMRAPEGLDGGGGPARAAGGGGPPPSGAASPAPAGSPAAAAPGAPGPAASAGLGGAMEAMGLRVGRDSEGRAAVLRRDGTPATARELELVRADAGGVLPYAAHGELLASYSAKPELRDTDFKHVEAPASEKDFRWSKSCDKVSGECNKHAGKGSYKRGDHVPPDDLADIWKSIKEAAGIGAVPRKRYDGSSHFARMRAMLDGGGEEGEGDAEGAVGGGGTGGAAPPAPGEEGPRRAFAPGEAPPEPGAGARARRTGRGTPRGRPVWPAWLISALVGGAVLWKFRRAE